MWNLTFEDQTRALDYAIKAHEGQYRKDGTTLYITHPIGVASIMHEFGGTRNQILAALFHDIVEDTSVTLAELTAEWGTEVGYLVGGLTNTSKQECPDLNREGRKAKDIERLLTYGVEVHFVKLADILYNITDLKGVTSGFAKKFVSEKFVHTWAIIRAYEGHELPDGFEAILEVLADVFGTLTAQYNIDVDALVS